MKRFDLAKYIIICTSFSTRHNFKIAKNLVKAIKSLEIDYKSRDFSISGRRDDEWYQSLLLKHYLSKINLFIFTKKNVIRLMVDFNDIAVHIFTEDFREEYGLERRLRTPASDKDTEEFLKIALNKKKK